MNLILFDDPDIRVDLLPFTYTRPTGKIRTGILTIDEKWSKRTQLSPSFLTIPYLQKKYTLASSLDNLLINGAVCPDNELMKAVLQLKTDEKLVYHDRIIASRQASAQLPDLKEGRSITYNRPITIIDKMWQIFIQNSAQVKLDFNLITAGRKSAGIEDRHTIVYNEANVFAEEGVEIRASIINAENGPVYLGKNSRVQEGCMIRGTFALGEGAQLNMGAKMRGDVSIGPHSKVGGEVSTSVVFGYSNKAHDGFLGCSVLGEWCNLGADSNTSNLKNNYDMVRIWSHARKTFVDTGQQFCGLMMGDHSKSGINTMFNTGTVVDVSCNIFGGGFPRNYIPSFSWGGTDGLTTYKLDKALQVAERAMARRDVALADVDREILREVHRITAAERTWEENKIYTT